MKSCECPSIKPQLQHNMTTTNNQLDKVHTVYTTDFPEYHNKKKLQIKTTTSGLQKIQKLKDITGGEHRLQICLNAKIRMIA